MSHVLMTHTGLAGSRVGRGQIEFLDFLRPGTDFEFSNRADKQLFEQSHSPSSFHRFSLKMNYL